jgi:hypothetical protein
MGDGTFWGADSAARFDSTFVSPYDPRVIRKVTVCSSVRPRRAARPGGAGRDAGQFGESLAGGRRFD